MTVRNIIFDLDGTLIDSSDGVVEAVNYSLRQMGEAEQPPHVIKSFIGYPLSQMYPTFTDAPVVDLYRHFQVKAAHTVVASTRVLPQVESVLSQLRQRGYRMGIASTKVKRHIDGIIEKFGWQKHIAAYAGGDEVTKVKPNPEILKLTLDRMHARPEESVTIGDTINDVLAARAVPMTVIAVASPYGGNERVLQASPDHFIESITDIFELLDKLEKEAS